MRFLLGTPIYFPGALFLVSELLTHSLSFHQSNPVRGTVPVAQLASQWYFWKISLDFLYNLDNVEYPVLESRFQDYISAVVLPYNQPRFDAYGFIAMRPYDLEALQSNPTYLSILRSIIAMRARYMSTIETRYEMVSRLDRLIRKELENPDVWQQPENL